jgi:hypothetical protein
MPSLLQPRERSGAPPSTPGRNEKAPLAALLKALRSAWRWISARPLWVQVVVWSLLAVVFAGPNILLLYVPVVIGLWLWETTRPLVLRRIGTSTDRKPASRAPQLDTLGWGQWLRHLAEMVVAMYAGMLVYMALVRPMLMGIGLAGLVAGDLSYSWMIAFMVAPMVALMRFQGHSWRMTDEMAVGMVAPVIVCFGLVRLGICPLVPFLTWLTPKSVYLAAHDAMLLGMIAVLVVRRGMYAHTPGPATTHAPHHAHAGGVAQPGRDGARDDTHEDTHDDTCGSLVGAAGRNAGRSDRL